MNIRDAILAAANQIEQHPESFHFSNGLTPGAGGGSADPFIREIVHCPEGTGCALGWIAHFVDTAYHGHGYSSALPQLGLPRTQMGADEFYDRMDSFVVGSASWRYRPDLCIKALRAYADRYHPAPPRTDAELVAELKAKLETEKYQPTLVDNDLARQETETA